MYSFGSKVLGAAAPKPPQIQFGYALISVLMRLTFTFGATFRHEEMLKACPLKCKLAIIFIYFVKLGLTLLIPVASPLFLCIRILSFESLLPLLLSFY